MLHFKLSVLPVPINTRLKQIGFVDNSGEIVKEVKKNLFLNPYNIKKINSIHHSDYAYSAFYARNLRLVKFFKQKSIPIRKKIPILVAQKS